MRVDFPKRFGTPKSEFGFASSSPLIEGEFLFVQAANSMVKLRKSTGETVWRALEHSGEPARLDPETGEVPWTQEVPNFRGMNILTPVVYGDAIITSSYQN